MYKFRKYVKHKIYEIAQIKMLWTYWNDI